VYSSPRIPLQIPILRCPSTAAEALSPLVDAFSKKDIPSFTVGADPPFPVRSPTILPRIRQQDLPFVRGASPLPPLASHELHVLSSRQAAFLARDEKDRPDFLPLLLQSPPPPQIRHSLPRMATEKFLDGFSHFLRGSRKTMLFSFTPRSPHPPFPQERTARVCSVLNADLSSGWELFLCRMFRPVSFFFPDLLQDPPYKSAVFPLLRVLPLPFFVSSLPTKRFA